MPIQQNIDARSPDAACNPSDYPARARYAVRALRMSDDGGVLSVADVAGIVQRGTWGRCSFALLMAVIGTAVLPLPFTLGWAAVMLSWELLVRPWLDGFAVKASQRSQHAGVRGLAAINFVGGWVYAVFPITAWMSQTPIGMVLAAGWVCGSATHAFVYFSSHRLILAAVLIPIAAMALGAPFAVAGITPIALTGAATLSALVLSAGMVGRDREMLLDMLATHADARAAAENSDRAKSQFLATMSHELRTPLNAIIGYSELIEEESAGGAAEDAAKIKVSAQQLLSVINNILDVSKLEAGTVTIERERVQLTEIVEHVREAAVPLVAANNNIMEIDMRGAAGDALLDPTRVHQCLMHLVANSAKFTRGGTIRLIAAKTVRNGRPVIQFDVVDTGIGVPADQRERIFEPFAQVETGEGRRFEGAGLGLTFVRRVARLMDGDAVCVPNEGRGAAFSVWVAAEGA